MSEITRLTVSNAVRLVTVDETAEPSSLVGCIVRLKPSSSVSEAVLRETAKRFRSVAMAVKVLPRPAVDKLVLKKSSLAGNPELPSNPREFLETLIGESSSKRRADLKSYVDELADEIGI